MWLRGFQRIGHADGGGGSAGLVFSTFARYFSRKRAENLRKINPKLTPQEASLVAQDLYGVVKQHGPLSISNAWIKAQVSPSHSVIYNRLYSLILNSDGGYVIEITFQLNRYLHGTIN